MARQILELNRFNGGISESSKEGQKGSGLFAKNLNIHDDPAELTLNPKTAKNSGSTVVDLVKWIVSGEPNTRTTYFYGDAGHIYSRNSAGTWADLRTVDNSKGQGLELHADYLYYTQNTQIGRYGVLSGSPGFTDAWQTGLNDTSISGLAPIKAFKEGFAVGNGNDLGWWDGSAWTQNKVVLPPEFEIRTLEVIDEFLVMGVWRRHWSGFVIHDGTQSLFTSDETYLFFWDGTATTFNFFIPVSEGTVQALLSSRNRLLSVVGLSGYIYQNYQPMQKVSKVPTVGRERAEVLPGAVTNFKGLPHLGVGGAATGSSVQQGVYAYGTRSDRYADSLSMSHTISTGTTLGTNVQIGSVKGIGEVIFIGWKDGTTYGVDRAVFGGDAFASGTFETLIFDTGTVGHDKLALVIKATHKALVSGESVQLGYKVNRAASYTTGTANATVGSTETRLVVPPSSARFREIQLEVILATTATTSPTVTSLSLLFDDLTEETEF